MAKIKKETVFKIIGIAGAVVGVVFDKLATGNGNKDKETTVSKDN